MPQSAQPAPLTRRGALEAERASAKAARRSTAPAVPTAPAPVAPVAVATSARVRAKRIDGSAFIAAPARRASASAPTSRPKRRRSGHPVFATLAAAGVLLLVAGTSVPSALFGPSSPAEANGATQSRLQATASVSSLEASSSTATGDDSQRFSVPRLADSGATISRDNFGVTSAPKPATLSAQSDLSTMEVLPSAVQWPFPTPVRSSGGYGPRSAPCAGCSTNHKGIDLVPGAGTPVGAIADGVVVETVESDEGLGVHAVVEHEIDGETISSVYGHMQFGSLEVKKGDTVTAGQTLGLVGNTGQSTGPHLHLEIWISATEHTDPAAWLTAHGAE